MRFAKIVYVSVILPLLCTGLSFAASYVYVTASASGPQVGEAATSFVDVPGLAITFFQYQPGNVCISVSAECYTIGKKRMFVRALVDGEVASPSDVILVNGDFRGTHAFQFSANVWGGQHKAVIQYKVDSGAQAQFGDRSMWIATAPRHIQTVSAPSGPDVSTAGGSFQDIPHMSTMVNMTQTSDLFISLSAEAEITAGKRMFVRAVVDGQPAKPSDVVFCASAFYGTRSFIFAAPGIPAGKHIVSLQWLVDGGATGYLGDRTMTVGQANALTMPEEGGTIVSISAPSGPQVSTTSAGMTAIPDLNANVILPENSQVCVALSAEAYTTNGKRMFVRAVIDGQPISPSNVVLNATDFDGVRSFHFISRFLAGGAHQIALQWQVDGGGAAYLGDRNMTVIAFRSPCPDINASFDNLSPADGQRPVLAICWDPHRPEHPAPALSDVQKLLFGAAPSVRDYYDVNSHNRVMISNAGVKGWYDAAKPASYYWGPEDAADSNGDGWIHPHVEKWAEAISKADPSFNFSAFDMNGDKYLSPEELLVLIVIPQNAPFGTVRTPYSKEYPAAQPLMADGVTIPIIAEAYLGAPPSLATVAHELAHALFNLPDEYFNFFMPYAAGVYSLMDICYSDSHLDPFLKIRLGWVQPAIISETTFIPIPAIEQSHIAYILYDPKHGHQEYFIVENRQPDIAYDSDLPDAGLAVWHIIEDAAVYGSLGAPAGVSAGDWATIGATDWGRRAIRMIRPVYGPPFNNALALWDGADPATGYDLLSTDPDASHATLKWADGSPSGFNIKEISASGQEMSALIEVADAVTDVEQEYELPHQYKLAQNFPNPFNSTTTIRYTIAGPTYVQLQIFNAAGQLVRTLCDRPEQAGEKSVSWDGNNDHGAAAASGVYICRCKTDKWTQMIKMLLVK
ncbi:MAG TPA: M6 family metalloprotease domain-containing protein [bacterium]|nr:M6 family metalloprotease domain-containing protein [bacterium]